MLQSAVNAVQSDHNPARALEILDDYDARFPAGTLAVEAHLTRLDGLLASGNYARALQLLEENDFSASPRGNELRVVHGELLARAGRCGEALVLLRAADVPSTAGPMRERALYAQASCLAQTGDAQHSRERLEEYLERYPSGRFADAARETLGL